MSEAAKQLDDSSETLPRLLKPGASHEDIIKAVNGLAAEVQLIRLTVRDIGSAVGEIQGNVREIKTFIGELRRTLSSVDLAVGAKQ